METIFVCFKESRSLALISDQQLLVANTSTIVVQVQGAIIWISVEGTSMQLLEGDPRLKSSTLLANTGIFLNEEMVVLDWD